MTRPMWMVRPRGRQATGDALRASSVVAIGLGREIGGLPDDADRVMLAERFRSLHPTWRHGRHRGAAAQLWSFVHEIEVGDRVLTYDATERRYFLGTVLSEPRFESAPPVDLPFRRDVDWTHRVERDHLPTPTRNALNILQTLFGVHGDHAAVIEAAAVDVDAPAGASALPPEPVVPPAATAPRIAAPVATPARAPAPAPSPAASPAASPTRSPPPDRSAPLVASVRPATPVEVRSRQPLQSPRETASAPVIHLPTRARAPEPPLTEAPAAPQPRVAAAEPSVEDLRARVEEQAEQLIEARLAALPASGIKALVAGVLAAMGYPNRQPAGHAPSGCDLYAAPNVLGLQEPMLHVRIDHRPDTQTDAAAVVGLSEVLPRGARALFVSTGGFTLAARERAQPGRGPHLTLLDMAELRRTLLDHYERIDLETRSLIPLTRIYWPAR
jgi:predicted Mrr-cat superfamily restriction endonuclease